MVGLRRDELVDQVAFRAHDLDAIVAAVLRHGGALDVVGYGLLDLVVFQRARRRRVDRRLQRRGRHRLRADGVAAGVEDLQADLAAVRMHGVGDNAVLPGLRLIVEDRRTRQDAAVPVRREAAGDDQADAALGALGIERRHARMTGGNVFQAGVHRTHQDAVFQGGEAEVERRQEVRVGGVHGVISCDRNICKQQVPKVFQGYEKIRTRSPGNAAISTGC